MKQQPRFLFGGRRSAPLRNGDILSSYAVRRSPIHFTYVSGALFRVLPLPFLIHRPAIGREDGSTRLQSTLSACVARPLRWFTKVSNSLITPSATRPL